MHSIIRHRRCGYARGTLKLWYMFQSLAPLFLCIFSDLRNETHTSQLLIASQGKEKSF